MSPVDFYWHRSRAAAMEKLGWQFVPTGPNEFEWVKFDKGNAIARQYDATWNKDVNRITE